MNRRKFVKGVFAMGGAGMAVGLYAWQIEPFCQDIRMEVSANLLF